jgi:hypothetical protein
MVMLRQVWHLAMNGRAPSTVVRVRTCRAALENLLEAGGSNGEVVPLLAVTGADATDGGGICSRSRSFSIIFATISEGTV